MARSLLGLVAALLLSGVLLLVHPSPASAHEQVLTSSEPPASATLSAPPDRVVLNFRWRVRPESAAVTVVGPDGATQWQQGALGAADRSIGVDLRELGPAGRYEVRYAGLTGRGHPFRGAVAFTLAAPKAAPAAMPATPSPSTELPLAWIVAVIVLTAAGSVVGVRLGRTPP